MKRFRNIVFVIMFFLLGGMNYSIHTTFTKNHIINFTDFEIPIDIRAKVVRTQYRNDLSAELVLNDVRICTQECYNLDGKLILYIQECNATFMYGDQLEFSTIIYRPDKPDNPGQFNYRRYLSDKNIYAQAWIDKSTEINKHNIARFSLVRFANIVKVKILKIIDISTNATAAPIVKALITGSRGEISDLTELIFIDSGVIHILAVSGLHVGYVTLVFLLIFGFLRFPAKTKYFLTICALWFYAAMVQFKPSVVRAVTMASCILMGKILERPLNVYNALGFAALIQTLILPKQLFHVGFQLSFVAVFSIIYIYNRLQHLLPEKFKPYKITRKLIRYFYQLFLVSLSAQIGTLPLTIYYFNRVPVISVIANLFAIPIVGIIGALGFAQIILGSIWLGFSMAYGEILNILVYILKTIISYSANLSFAYFPIRQFSVITIILIYGLTFLLLNFDKRRFRVNFLILVLMLMNFNVWQKVINKPSMKVVFFDVGQGDAAYVEFPNGKNMLIDCGMRGFYRNYARDIITPYLEKEGIKKIDVLGISHPHNDHIGGAPYILENFSVRCIWETGITAESKVFREMHYIADSLNVPIVNPYAGDVFTFGDNTYLQILHPSQKYIKQSRPNFNNASTTFKLTYKKVDLLFTGDIEKEAEEYLILYNNYLDSEIIKVPHHGSSTSSTYSFIHYSSPQYGVISVGEKNKFGHPSKNTINKYKKVGCCIHRTDQMGALLIETDGNKIDVVDYRY
ncbi:MAG: DNA internalization-related competence protein ComEC/Rec2 [Candidatus Marinimicrobia bacterium]|nr:DNA internalization-related competence protein ComEC/Rec2 [Candidatus Neomarinimicrobiota bacterium]